MRKIILCIAVGISFFGFSQEKPFEKISQFDIQLKWNQAQLRLDQTIGNIKYPFRFEGTVRFQRADMLIGMTFPLGKQTFIACRIGQEYFYTSDEWNSLLGVSFRSIFRYGIIRVDYGSNWIDSHGVSTSLMYNLIGPLVRIGVASNNEYVGPRTELQLGFGENRKKKVRLHVAYFPKENRFDYSVRVRFKDWFPKWDTKIKQLEDTLNPFEKSK
jgi:hypothetical protein